MAHRSLFALRSAVWAVTALSLTLTSPAEAEEGAGASAPAEPPGTSTEDPRLGVQIQVEPGPLDGRGRLTVELAVPDGWHLWTFDPGEGPLPLRITVEPGLQFLGPWHGPEPHALFDPGFGRELNAFTEGTLSLQRAFQVTAAETALQVEVRGQICSDRRCLNQSRKLPLRFEAAPAGSENAPAPAGTVLSEPPTRVPSPPASEAPSAVWPSALAYGGNQGSLWSFLLLSFFFGLGALLTPCVFPAIPLTISFFSKYRETGVRRTAALALVYSLTMVVAFAAAGVAVSLLFGVTGVQRFASHPVFNLALGLALLLFALNLMGLFEIQIPHFLLRGVNRLERRFGRASDRARGVTGGAFDYVVVAVAALTATTVFFTCTVGFVGVVLVAAAQGQILWPTLGMLAFATAFALPFFLLALFPRLAHSLAGRSGSWMAVLRVLLGLLELVAATKFLSNADLVWRWELLTRDAVLSLWVPVFALAGLFLLGKVQMGEVRVEGSRPGSVLSAVMILALSTYLAAHLMQGRAFGSWIDGWLPPLEYPGRKSPGAGPTSDHSSRWTEDLQAARDRARREGRPLFLNYTGYTCTNCRFMEAAIFPRPGIQALLEQTIAVELYTDGGQPMHDAYRRDQVERFHTAALPFYALEAPDGRILGTFESSTNDPEVFRRFLEEALGRL